MPQKYQVKLSDGRTFQVETDGAAPSEADVMAYLQANPTAVKAETPSSTPAPAAPQTAMSAALQKAGVLLPTAGGIVGGIVGSAGGPVGAIASAGAGGMVGERLREYIDAATGKEPLPTQGEALSRMAKQAVGQAAGQAVGEGAVAGAGVMSKWLMNRATSRVSAKLMQDFPDLNETLIDKALTVSKGGYERAAALLKSAAVKQASITRAGDAAGVTLPVELNADLADSLKTALLESALKKGQLPVAPNAPITAASERLTPALKARFAEIDQAVAKNATLDLRPTEAELFRQQLQREAKPNYANRVAPNGPKAMGAWMTEAADYATQLNHGLDQLLPGYADARAATQPLIGATRGLKQAIRPSGNLYQAMVRPGVGAVLGAVAGEQQGGHTGAALGSALGAAMASPAGMSREAILLARPEIQAVIRQLPKPIAQALVEALSGSTSAQAPTPAGAVGQ